MWSRRRVDGSFPRDNSFRPPIFSGSTSFPLPLRFCAREVLKNESPNGTTRRSTAPRMRKNASFDIDSSQFPRSSPFFVAFVDRAPLPPAQRTRGRDRPSLSRCRESSLKKRENKRERKTTRTARPSLLSLDANESNERTRNDAIECGFC